MDAHYIINLIFDVLVLTAVFALLDGQRKLKGEISELKQRLNERDK